MTAAFLAKIPLAPALGPVGEAALFAAFLFVFAFAWAWFADSAERMTADVRCACGRRELRDVVCAPQDRTRLAAELTHCCPWCAARVTGGQCPVTSGEGDHDE